MQEEGNTTATTMEAAAGDLQAVMAMLSSSQMEEQCRLLRARSLLDEMRRAVADVHGALTATGATTSSVALAARTRSVCAPLRDALEAVLAMEGAATTNTLFRAIISSHRRRRRRRGAIINDLGQSLHHLRELSSLASAESIRSFLRYDSLEIERAVRANTIRDALAEPMVGRSELAEKMMRVLLAVGGEEDGPLVMPIVGGPGIGKTRIVQALFNDSMVREKFPVRRWENVSERFNLFKMRMPNIWFNSTKFQNFLDEFINKSLNGRKGKYLVVLDDVWNENEAQDWPEWDSLMQALPSNGAVIFTTQTPMLVSKTAAVVPRTFPYFLQPLQQEHTVQFVHQWLKRCWLDRSSEPFNIGMKIASKCDGVPLLIQSAGAILCRRPEAAFWQQFLEDFDVFFEGSGLYSSDEEGSDILESAYSSYKHLPSHLQSCFLYCSMFPLGFNFDAEELADLFATAELTGAQRIGFLEQLLNECFYPIEDSEYGGKFIYRMHKILHIFAVYMERELSTVVTADKDFTQVQPSVRLMSLIIAPSTASFPRYIDQLKHLKALILLQDSRMLFSDQRCEIKEIDPMLCQSLKHLQALSLQATKIRKLPNKIELVPHLRYLNLSQTNIETIPSSVSKLRLLQTLILSHCEKLWKLHENICKLVRLHKLDLEGCLYLVTLPTKMSKMKKLQYLNVLNCYSLTAMPLAMGQLTNLHTLLGYFVPNNGSSAMSELQSLPDLNRLSLVNLEKVSDTEDARMAKLQEKEKLETLMLRWNMDAGNASRIDHEVLETLQPSQCLKTLEIVAYEGYVFPSWMTRTEPYLTSLVEIRLVNMRACEKALPPLGILPCLKIAEISGVDNLSSIGDNFYGHNGTFPSLEKLILSYMTSLEVWEQSSRMNLFPRLAELVIIQCPKLRALHMEFPSIEKLILWMNNKMLYSSKEGMRGVEKSLENLSISFCEELHASSGCEGLQALDRLKKLEICGCHELSCLPQGFQHLSSLTSLKIDNCNKLEILPEWLENLPFLQIMCLSGCPILHSIPEGLTCSDIIVEDCPNFKEPSGMSSVLCSWKAMFLIFIELFLKQLN